MKNNSKFKIERFENVVIWLTTNTYNISSQWFNQIYQALNYYTNGCTICCVNFKFIRLWFELIRRGMNRLALGWIDIQFVLNLNIQFNLVALNKLLSQHKQISPCIINTYFPTLPAISQPRAPGKPSPRSTTHTLLPAHVYRSVFFVDILHAIDAVWRTRARARDYVETVATAAAAAPAVVY